jgi:hypothetical protein
MPSKYLFIINFYHTCHLCHFCLYICMYISLAFKYDVGIIQCINLQQCLKRNLNLNVKFSFVHDID